MAIDYDTTDGTLAYAANLEGHIGEGIVPEPVDIAIRTSGNQQQADIERVEISATQGRVVFQGQIDIETLQPIGLVHFEEFAYLNSAPLLGTLDLEQTDGSLFLSASRLHFGAVILNDINLELTTTPQASMLVGGFSLSDNPDLEEEPTQRVTMSATLVSDPDRTSRMDVSLRGLDVADLYGMAAGLSPTIGLSSTIGLSPTIERSNEYQSNYAIDADLQVQFNRQQLAYQASSVLLYERAQPQNHIALDAEGNDEGFVVSGLSLQVGNFDARGELAGEIASDGGVTMEMGLESAGNRYDLQAIYEPRGVVRLEGNHDLVAMLFLDEQRGNIFQLSATDLPFTVSNTTLSASLDINGFYSSIDRWDVRISQLLLKIDSNGLQDALSDPEREIEIAGTINPRSGELSGIRYRDPISELNGTATISFDLDEVDTLSDIVVTQANLLLETDDKEERYTLNGVYHAERFDLAIEFVSLPLGRIGFEPLRGRADGNLRLFGSIEDPQTTMNVRIDEGLLNAGLFSATVTAGYNSGR